MSTERPPVFIVGYGRSGTEMIRFMLNGHPGIAITPEYPKFALYDIELLTETLWGDWSGSRRWDDQDALRDDLRVRVRREPARVLEEYGRAWAEKNGKPGSRWGDKYTANWQFMDRLAEWYPGAQFIHLVRDPRDVISSIIQHFPKSIMLPGSLVAPHINLAWRWRKSLRQVLNQGEALGSSRYVRLRYEDNVTDPKKTAQLLCRFLDLDFQESMLTAHKDIQAGKAHAPSKHHEELAKPINTLRIGRHEVNLTPAQIEGIQAVCRDEIEAMGYDLMYSEPSVVRRIGISVLSTLFEVGWGGVRGIRRLRGRL